MSDVFISYSSKESDKANLVRDVLKRNGINTWMAPDSIPGGSNYTKEIPRAIKECKVFLLILSQNAQGSVWVPAELEQAFKNEKIIIPFAVENCPLGDEFDFLLSRSQRIEAYEKNTDAMEKLVNTVKRSISTDEESQPYNKTEKNQLPAFVSSQTRVHAEKPVQEDKENLIKAMAKYFISKNKEGHAYVCRSAKDMAKNSSVILRLDRELNQRGIKTWITEKNISSGENFSQAIAKAIEDCTVFLLFVSANSVNSAEVVSEVSLCRKFRKTIIPILIDDVDPFEKPEWAYMLKSYQMTYMSGQSDIKNVADIIENYFK